jgi:DNA-binding transcriptional MerR regulator
MKEPLTIGALARSTATNIETIRYYEKIGLLPAPARTAANYRAYGPDHLARLSFVRRSRDLGFSIEAVRDLLRLSDQKRRDCASVGAIACEHLAQIDRKIADLTSLRRELQRLMTQCGNGRIDSCRVIETLGPSSTGQARAKELKARVAPKRAGR